MEFHVSFILVKHSYKIMLYLIHNTSLYLCQYIKIQKLIKWIYCIYYILIKKTI